MFLVCILCHVRAVELQGVLTDATVERRESHAAVRGWAVSGHNPVIPKVKVAGGTVAVDPNTLICLNGTITLKHISRT